MKSVTFIGVDIQGLMQTRKMLLHFESNVGNVVVIIVDSQRIVEFTDCSSLVTKAHITISVLNSDFTICYLEVC